MRWFCFIFCYQKIVWHNSLCKKKLTTKMHYLFHLDAWKRFRLKFNKCTSNCCSCTWHLLLQNNCFISAISNQKQIPSMNYETPLNIFSLGLSFPVFWKHQATSRTRLCTQTHTRCRHSDGKSKSWLPW